MLINRIEKGATLFFFCSVFFIMLLLSQAQILTWLNQFKILYILMSTSASLITAVIFGYFIKKDLNLLPSLKMPALLIISLVCSIIILFPHDTFGGRDEGAYSNLAIYLANNGSLITPLYLDHIGAGIETMKGKPHAYTIWLAIQAIFFNEQWLLRSNAILIFLGLLSLYLFSLFLIGKKTISLMTLVLYVTSMPFLWFSRETMTENLSFFLIWTSLVFLFSFFRTKHNIYLIGLILCSSLFSFTRLEGAFVQFTTFFVFSLILFISKSFTLKKTLTIVLIYFSIILSVSFTSNTFNSSSYFKLNSILVSQQLMSSVSRIRIEPFEQNKQTILRDNIPIFLIRMLAKYNLAIILFSIFIIIPIVLIDKKIDKEGKIFFSGVLIILLPEFYKLVDPSVTMEQPWMYRRYLYALIPIGYLSFSILLDKLNYRRFSLFLFSMFLIINISLSSKIITLKNNWFLTGEMEKLLQNVSTDDFVIIKDRIILNNYYPIAFLSYGKSVRSLFSYWIEGGGWDPKKKQFQGITYKRIYLLSDKEFELYKGFILSKKGSVDVEYRQLDPNCELTLLRDQLGLRTSNVYYLPYSDVINYCSPIENKILEVKKKIYLYELTYSL